MPVSEGEMAALLASLPPPGPASAPGGSAANVTRGAAQILGAAACEATFYGMVGGDATGRAYAAALEARGVRPALLVAAAEGGGGKGKPGNAPPTAVCACLVTPDG